MKSAVDPGKPPTTRPWIKGCGVAVITVVWLPLLVFVGAMAFISLNVYRARVTAEEARAAVGIGTSLSDAIRVSSERVGTVRFLQCYRVMCVDPTEVVLASRDGRHSLGVLAADGSQAVPETVDEWHRELLQLDRVRCTRAKITFCGRPWITFFLELDGSQHVRKIGPLSVSAD